jgi:hypothetical protein
MPKSVPPGPRTDAAADGTRTCSGTTRRASAWTGTAPRLREVAEANSRADRRRRVRARPDCGIPRVPWRPRCAASTFSPGLIRAARRDHPHLSSGGTMEELPFGDRSVGGSSPGIRSSTSAPRLDTVLAEFCRVLVPVGSCCLPGGTESGRWWTPTACGATLTPTRCPGGRRGASGARVDVDSLTQRTPGHGTDPAWHFLQARRPHSTVRNRPGSILRKTRAHRSGRRKATAADTQPAVH